MSYNIMSNELEVLYWLCMHQLFSLFQVCLIVKRDVVCTMCASYFKNTKFENKNRRTANCDTSNVQLNG